MSVSSDRHRLVRQLMAGASGVYLYEAAVRLLDRHGYWLHSQAFLSFIVVNEAEDHAGIDFRAATNALDNGSLSADDEEAEKILRIAASLYGWYSVNIREVVEGIDRENIKHVAEAIMYADGFLNSVADPRP